jgi:transposase-like protein
MAKPSRWTAEKRYQIVKEALSQKEPLGQIARRHQVSERLIYAGEISFSKAAKRRWRLMGAGVQRRESGVETAGGRAAEADW